MLRAQVVALAIGMAAAAFAPPAAAYVRYTSDAGVMFAWPQSCVLITAYPANFVTVMPLEEIQGAMGAAASAWSSSGDPCTYLSISVTSSTGTAPRAVNDHRNSIIFRTSSWCELLADGTCSADVGPYDQAALAVTSVVANKQTGQIRDADIEINAFHHPWGDLIAHPELFAADARIQDLQNALTHEMGHLIGLDHTCVPAGTLPRPIDNLGNPVPDCSTASADVQATTMFPSAQPGDTREADARAGRPAGRLRDISGGERPDGVHARPGRLRLRLRHRQRPRNAGRGRRSRSASRASCSSARAGDAARTDDETSAHRARPGDARPDPRFARLGLRAREDRGRHPDLLDLELPPRIHLSERVLPDDARRGRQVDRRRRPRLEPGRGDLPGRRRQPDPSLPRDRSRDGARGRRACHPPPTMGTTWSSSARSDGKRRVIPPRRSP